MRHTLSYIIPLLVFAVLSASCSKERIDLTQLSYELNLSTTIDCMNSLETRADLLGSTSAVPGDSLILFGWENDSYWIQGVKATFSSGAWSFSGNYSMDSDKNYSYLAYANVPSDGAVITPTTSKSGDISYAVTDITAAQSDVLLGRESLTNPSSGNASIDFSHPYASVRLKLGIGLGTIKSASLWGAYASGSTTYGLSSTADSQDVMTYSWTGLGKANAKLEATGLSKTEGDTLVSFLVIPQDLSSKNVVITITDSSDKSYSKLLNSGSWKAGYTTTYTLGVIGDLDITVSGPTITNSSDTKAYVRAAVTGAWYDESGNIVYPWPATTDPSADPYYGTFTDLFPSGSWTEDSGLYYLSAGLAAGSSINVWSAYTKASTAPVEGAVLKLDILVQAIPYNVNKTCLQAFEAL